MIDAGFCLYFWISNFFSEKEEAVILAGKEVVLMRLTGLYKEDKDTEEAGVEGKVAGIRLRVVSAESEHRVALCLHCVKNTFHLEEKKKNQQKVVCT